MRKAQGSLEYLIIIAAVLAVAAVVVMFLTGALGGASAGGNVAQCRVAAAGCRSDIDTLGTAAPTCLANCIDQCTNAAANDLLTDVAYDITDVDSAVYKCQHGNATI